jgi:hypothetical protein
MRARREIKDLKNNTIKIRHLRANLGRTSALLTVKPAEGDKIHAMHIKPSSSLMPARSDLNIKSKEQLEVLKAEYEAGRERLAE